MQRIYVGECDMEGYILTYKPVDDIGRVKMHHRLFGRIIYRNYRGKKYAYYNPGILDNIKFYRLSTGKIFIQEKPDITDIKEFAEIDISPGERDEKDMLLITGEEYWNKIAKERELFLKRGGKK